LSRKKISEESYQVPIWVITFSDMTTNLLTFFVLLMSMGHMRDETLFDQGQALEYLESVKRGFGIVETPDFGNIKIKYFISTPDELSKVRIIDAKEEELRRIFQKVNRSMSTMTSQIVAERTNFSITNIRFSPHEAILDESAKRFLKEFCLDLQQNTDSKKKMLYVLGLADEQLPEKQQWILSARRAQAVADFFEGVLPSASGWRVYSWGAGTGGDWVAADSAVSEQSQILIAVLRSGD